MKTVESICKEVEGLVLFRGTKKDICDKLNSIGLIDNVVLYEFECFLIENDFGFNVNLGIIGDSYLDFEIYLLPTNKKDVLIVTETTSY